ncbi:MAG: glycosyltransferase [Pseudomonadota bacterium]
MMQLAVATENPASVAETYVRQHMRALLPGQTVGIALHGTRDDVPLDMPFFVRGRRSGGWPQRKVASISALVRSGYAAALSTTEEAALSAFLKEHSVSTLLAEFGTTGLVLRRVAKSNGLRFVVNFHGFDATVLPKRQDIRRAYKRLARDADAFVCGSNHFASILHALGFPAEKVHVIPCGVDPVAFSVGDRDGHTVLGVGRLTEKKRPDLTIRAFALAKEKVPQLRLELIGDGPKRAMCEDVIREKGLAGSVTLHGAKPHDEVRAAMARASIFVQHSMTATNGDQESQGISLIEAMSSELPVVATDHNGFSETVADGVTGMLSPEGDVEKMANNLVTLASDPALRVAMGAAGRDRVAAHFDAAKTTERLRALLFPMQDYAVKAAQ